MGSVAEVISVICTYVLSRLYQPQCYIITSLHLGLGVPGVEYEVSEIV